MYSTKLDANPIGARPSKAGRLETQLSLPIAILAVLLVSVTTAEPAASAPGIHEIANTVTLTGTSTGPVLVSCPPGEVALGGGWSVPPRAHVFAAALKGNTWAVSVAHAGLSVSTAVATEPKPGAETGAVTAYVECVYGVPGLLVTSQTLNFSAQPNSELFEGMVCNPNAFAVGFGFDLGGSNANISLKSNFPDTAIFGIPIWFFYGTNQDSVAHSVSVSIQCLTYFPGLSADYPANTGGNVYAGTMGTVTAPCPVGMQVAGGGLNYTGTGTGIANPYLLHAANGGWQDGIYGLAGSGLTPLVPSAYAICLGFPQTTLSNAPVR